VPITNVVKGQLERKKKHIEIRGLNENCNHDLKNLFKGAAVVASTKPGPFEEFYAALLGQGHEAGNGVADLGQEDCHDRSDRLEERSGASTPTSETTNRTIVAIFLAKVSHAISGLMPLASKARKTLRRAGLG